MEPFSFEHTFQFDEDLYVQLNSIFTRKNRSICIVAALIFGLLCLFWEYSLLLGIAILLVVAISLFMPHLLPQTAVNNFRKINYLNSKLTYGVSDKKLWLKGAELNVEIGWQHSVVWEEREGWLRISSSHIPTLWFRVEELKKAEVYKRLIELCKTNAVQYDS